jgi:DNA ligase-1
MHISEPLLAAKFNPKNAKQLAIVQAHLPLYASFKLDGVRAIGQDSTLLSRTFKPIPNNYVRELFEDAQGFDGELILGDPTDALVYNKTVSAVMKADGTPDVRWYVFDNFEYEDPFEERLRRMGVKMPANVVKIHQHLCKSWDSVLEYEKHALTLGYEGLILRAPNGPYKQGCSTLNQGFAIKLKRFVDAEALVIGMVELQHNGNEQKMNEVGKLKRSTHQAGKFGGGTMGALKCRDVESGIEFECGTGFTAEERQWWWDKFESRRERMEPAQIHITYKSFKIGVKDKPRQPVFFRIRHKGDMPK